MTSIEQKALALVNEVQADWNYQLGSLAFNRDRDAFCEALCRAIEQHEAFRQEVSDVAEEVVQRQGKLQALLPFIIPALKLDPLEDALDDMGLSPHYAEEIRAALDALGFEIREKNDG